VVLDQATPLPDGAIAPVSGTFTYELDAGAYPPTSAHPSVLVYLPSGYRPIVPLAVLVYIHGFDNCVENIIRDAGQECTPGAGVRDAYSLAAQLENSGKNVMFVAPEIAYDQATGDPGNLGATNGLRALLTETFADLAPVIGAHTVDQIGTLIVSSHSGGYWATAMIASKGGVPVNEIWLLDSLYGYSSTFDAWIKSDLPGAQATPPTHRFADVYTSGGGTLANSQALADTYPLDGGWVVDDRVPANTWTDDVYQHGVLFKYSGLAHNDVPRYYFGHLTSTSQLPAK